MSLDIETFRQQSLVLDDQSQIVGAFAGKRGGKTEVGAIRTLIEAQQQPGYDHSNIDPFSCLIVAPTNDMMRSISLKKFDAYAKGFVTYSNKQDNLRVLHNNSEIWGISGDKPQRVEGRKINYAWIDEVFQVKEELFLEVNARVGDTGGRILCTGSLGPQYNVPKHHWVWKYFKDPDTRLDGTGVHEWGTADNPHFPQDRLAWAKKNLDKKTYTQMYEICWDAAGTAAVYNDLQEDNQRKHEYNPLFETHVSIDWGWAHEMAVGFFQYDPYKNEIYLFDEIVGSKLKLEDIYNQIMNKGYKIRKWFCDAAGSQTREQSGISNIQWFRKKGINFTYSRSAVSYGITLLRSWIRNSEGVPKFFIDPRCKKSWEQMINYRYKEKNGILDEEPIKEKDDCPDMIRYYVVNNHNILKGEESFGNYRRLDLIKRGT